MMTSIGLTTGAFAIPNGHPLINLYEYDRPRSICLDHLTEVKMNFLFSTAG